MKWTFATPLNPLPQRCLWDQDQRLGMAGDWCGGPRIEGAYLSGMALAEAALL
jgi:predicted NAD/FAD-dependent oxidoreductase